jgi:predicted ATPase
MASMPFARTINEIEDLYSRDLLKASHGESYLAFFGSRVKGNELYLLDEPETPLSIQNQLSLLLLINEGVNNSQFIIATHSPIMVAITGTWILEISSEGINEISYQ